MIAERAGVNKQLIYYYYGSKDDLYRTAIEAVYAEIRRLERGLKLGDLPPQRAMARLVGFSFDYLLEHPDFIGLLNHENAHGAVHVRHSSAIRRTNSPLIEMIRSTLKRGIDSKRVSPRRRSGRAVHRGGRHVVFLLLEPADAGGDLRSRPDESAQHRVVSPAHRGAGDERPAALIPLAWRQDLPGRSARPDTSTDSESTGHDEKPAQAEGRRAAAARRRPLAEGHPRCRDARVRAFGLGGARVDRIAERAGANKRLIYYYFGNKESLFLAVLEVAYEHIRREEQRLHLTRRSSRSRRSGG